ncbi:MAG TPA: alpha/beta hydrolase-fold protein [Clostridia bacterium]|nr:alpha/beta hydrolase-fold protein [Clostridia bacterium]
MSIIQVEFLSTCLRRQVSFKAILPLEKPGIRTLERRNLKTLYLLHGYMGHCMDWLADSCIHELAQRHDMAVIMPSGENSFYVDNPDYENYFGQFIGEELIGFTRALFPLSEKREDTLIGGFSMGGFGAIRNGLKYSDVFGSIIALSSALITDKLAAADMDFTKTPESEKYYIKTFGRLDQLEGSDNDPKALAKKAADSKVSFPGLYMACGTEDFLLEDNRVFKRYLDKLGVPFTYVEDPGSHDWKFWNPHIEKALDWYKDIHTA